MIFFVSKKGSLNQFLISVIVAMLLKGAISSVRSPPLRHINPFGTGFCETDEIRCLVISMNRVISVTALQITKSYFSCISSDLPATHFTFFRSSEEAMADATFIFFAIESRRVNCISGNIIARGNPGRPPPVPTSMILVPGEKLIKRAIASEWRR